MEERREQQHALAGSSSPDIVGMEKRRAKSSWFEVRSWSRRRKLFALTAIFLL
jgi:hypothetical protein